MSERDWLVFDDAVRNPEVRKFFDAAVVDVASGTAKARGFGDGGYPLGFICGNQKLLGAAVLEYVVSLVPADEFDVDAAQEFSERMRVLLGWHDIDPTLRRWVQTRLRDPYFVNEGSDWDPNWVRKPDADAGRVPESFFRFACYIAICNLKYGASYASVTAGEIFGFVTQLGSDLPARLKKEGTGDLPAELVSFTSGGLSAKANDALAVIRLRMTNENEASYAAALDYLAGLLETSDFPRSFAIEFRGATKTFLPVKGLPKKGVHQFFAGAVAYPPLWPAIARYARAAMRTFEWYTNFDDEDCAMPGTFAVFALGLAATEHAPLVLDYLREVDGEHQSMQAKFVAAYIETHGFTPEAVAYLVTCAGNIQHLEPRRTYASMMANRESLEALLGARTGGGTGGSTVSSLRAALANEPAEDYAWRRVLHAIWGEAAAQRGPDGRAGAKIIDRAPEDLQELYTQVFTSTD